MAPTLRLYNTLTRTKEEFRPLDPANVRMYVCGPTVYDYAHIGNARPIIVFDVLFRLLRHLYGPDHVTYVRNITDVDDKINTRAAERGVSIRDVTEETTQRFHEDIAALGVLPPTVEPRATEHIDEMKALIERLVANGHAYVAEDHVLFDVPSMPDYGSLSKRPLDEMEAGARVDVAPYKRSPLDFVLWKPSRPGDPAWPSPAGIVTPGRPGWHIECSAMSWKHLGETFDIHAGGIDLVFPHHENEAAQSRCCFGTDVMANVWMHNGFLQVEGEKMAKSTGNFVTIRELLKTEKFGGRSWPGEVLRLAMLRTHYRQPIDWTVRGLEEAAQSLNSWMTLVSDINFGEISLEEPESGMEALYDDLNTPGAISQIHRLAAQARRDTAAQSKFLSALQILGLVDDLESLRRLRDSVEQAAKLYFETPKLRARIEKYIAESGGPVAEDKLRNFITGDAHREIVAARKYALRYVPAPDIMMLVSHGVEFDKVNQTIEARIAARGARNWAESDRIRDELATMGIALKDNKDGTTTWDVAP